MKNTKGGEISMSNKLHMEFLPFISLYKTQLDEFKAHALTRNRSVAKDRLESMLAVLKKRINYNFEMNSQMMRDYRNLVHDFELQLSTLS